MFFVRGNQYPIDALNIEFNRLDEHPTLVLQLAVGVECSKGHNRAGIIVDIQN